MANRQARLLPTRAIIIELLVGNLVKSFQPSIRPSKSIECMRSLLDEHRVIRSLGRRKWVVCTLPGFYHSAH